MALIDVTNDQNTCVELFKATFTHQQSNYASNKKLETALSSLLYEKNLRILEGRDLNILENECILW